MPNQSRRQFCEECSPPRIRGAAAQAEQVPAPDPGTGAIEAAVRAELERASRLDTIEGVALLTLARDADRMPADKRAAVIERLLRVKALALVGVKPAGLDPVDDIARRRAERLADAG